MTPSEERLYRWLSEATEVAPEADDDDLLGDPGMMRCLDALTGQKPATLTDIEECYHDVESPDNVEEREFSSDEQGMYAAFSAMMDVAPTKSSARAYAEDEGVTSAQLAELLGVPFHDPERGVHVLPRTLVEQIDRTYEEVRRSGHLTPSDFENELYEWISRG